MLIKLLNPQFFTIDFNLIDELRQVQDAKEFEMALNIYHDDCRLNRNFFHDDLTIRISTRRLIALFEKLAATNSRVRLNCQSIPAKRSADMLSALCVVVGTLATICPRSWLADINRVSG